MALGVLGVLVFGHKKAHRVRVGFVVLRLSLPSGNYCRDCELVFVFCQFQSGYRFVQFIHNIADLDSSDL